MEGPGSRFAARTLEKLSNSVPSNKFKYTNNLLEPPPPPPNRFLHTTLLDFKIPCLDHRYIWAFDIILSQVSIGVVAGLRIRC